MHTNVEDVETQTHGDPWGMVDPSCVTLVLRGMRLDAVPKNLHEMCPRLEELDLSANSLNLSELGESLGGLRNLKRLALDDNCALEIQSLPEGLGELENLELLTARNCHLADLPADFHRLKGLTELDLGANYLSENMGSLVGGLEGLTNLKALDLSENELSHLPACVQRLPKLEVLCLDHNPIESLPETIGELRSLRQLTLHGASRLDHLPRSMGSLAARDVSIYGLRPGLRRELAELRKAHEQEMATQGPVPAGRTQ